MVLHFINCIVVMRCCGCGVPIVATAAPGYTVIVVATVVGVAAATVAVVAAATSVTVV